MHEPYIPLRRVPNLSWLPPRRNGSKIAQSTLWRWRTIGVNGAVLRTIRIGSTWCTTETWLRKFFEDSAAPTNPADRPLIRTPVRRARQIARTQDRLARKGFSRALDGAIPELPWVAEEPVGQTPAVGIDLR